MTNDDLCFLPVYEAADLLAKGDLSPTTLTQAYIDRIERVDGSVFGYLHVDADGALVAARKAEAELHKGQAQGALHGIPFGLKDNIDVAGMRTTAASRVLVNNVPETHSPISAALLNQGAVLLGKHNTWEFGTGTGEVQPDLFHPVARNPWDTTRFTGGSSSGTGASVAAGMAAFGIGSDTGGSIRVPAAANGLVGLKPTLGLLSQRGILPNSPAFDCPGPLTRCVTDAALVMQALTCRSSTSFDASMRRQPAQNYSAGLDVGIKGLRIGFIESFHTRDVNATAEIVANLDAAAALLTSLGANVSAVSLPFALQDYRTCVRVIGQAESLALHGHTFAQQHALMGKALRDKYLSSLLLRGDDVVHAMCWRAMLTAAVTRLFSEFDVLLCASSLHQVPALNDQPGMQQFVMGSGNVCFSVTGHPTLVLPSGVDARGMPMSIQLVAPHFQEVLLLQAGAAYERARAINLGRPSLQAGPASSPVEIDEGLLDIDLVSMDMVRDALRNLGMNPIPEELLQRAQLLCSKTRSHIARMPRKFESGVVSAHAFDATEWV